MNQYSRQAIAFAVALSCLAGYVDASGFLATGGIFVSFMSGNSTRLGVQAGHAEWDKAVLFGGVVILFVLGVVTGSVVSRKWSKSRKSAVLCLVCLYLAVATAAAIFRQTYLSTSFLVLAMGAENTVFQRDGEVSIGLTYMTGSLVKLGQSLANVFYGGSRTAWTPYALLWVGLTCGAGLGALAHQTMRETSLLPAVLFAGLLALLPKRWAVITQPTA